jgi:phosphate-selective porin OprO and OprP
MRVRFAPNRGLFLVGLLAFTWGSAASAQQPEITLSGRVHLDTAWHDEDQVPLSDGFLNRRSRLAVRVKLDDVWSGLIDYDFAENSTTAADVFLSRKLGAGTLQLGQFKVPMGLNELTGSNAHTFIERSTPSNLLVDARRIGVGYDWFQGATGFQAMAYGRRIGTSQQEDTPLGVAGRLVYSPAVADGALLHLAGSVAYEDYSDPGVLRFRDRPESRVDGNRLIDTGNITEVSSTFKYGLEAAFQRGPFSVEGEYFTVDVSRDSGSEPTFDGYHVQASYVLTGEKRGYQNGVFRGVTPGSPRGAWEIAARFSSADLVDAGFQGGTQDNITLALNYYASRNVRFMLNYILVSVEDSAAVVAGNPVGDDEPNILLGRVQFHF